MHFVEDASVPEHVRNDTHIHEAALRYVGIPGYGNYESWIFDEHKGGGSVLVDKYLKTIKFPDPAILKQATGDAAVPVPVARLIDTNRYDGTDPNVTLNGPIGIAEFANANFFSKDTGNGKGYPFPRHADLGPSIRTSPSGRHVRRYYDKKKDSPGQMVQPILAECVFDQAALAAGIPSHQVTCTDQAVWEAVARIMLPRALGYATAALDYFFRGRLGVQVERQGQVLGLRITNLTDGEPMEGIFNLYYEWTDGQRTPLASWFRTLEPNVQSEFLPFPSPPKGFKGYALLFEGKLGLESGAIAGRVFDPVPGAYVFYVGRGEMPSGPTDYRSFGVFPQPTPVVGADFSAFEIRARAGEEIQSTRHLGYLYRALYESPGDRLRLVQYPGSGGCYAFANDGTPPDGYRFLGPLGPASVEIFEAETPMSVTDMEEYTYTTPPVERDILLRLQVTEGMAPLERALEKKGVRLLGVRVVTDPGYPQLPFDGGRTHQCDASWQVEIVPP
jgi:hypothetical protein